MKDVGEDQGRVVRWALPASVVVHGLLAALVVLGLPAPKHQAAGEETVNVEIVPPPDEPKPLEMAKAEPPPPPKMPEPEKIETPEEAKPEPPVQEAKPEPPPEEAKPEETKPEETKPEEAKPEKPPEEQQAEEQQAAPPPPPPEPAAPEQQQEAKAEPPPPEQQQEAKAEQPSQPETEPVIQPVFRYGEEDAGPRETPDGSSAEEGAVSPETLPDAEPEPPAAAETPAATPAEATTETPDPELPDVLAVTPRHADRETASAALVAAPKPAQPAAPPKASAAPKLQQAKTLYSRSSTGATLAMTAMNNVPRGVRATGLCVTELRAQLLRGSPAFSADRLPNYPLKSGTVIEAPAAAFRAGGQWYDIAYRCELDADITHVVSFAHRVGGAVPRSDWKRRGLPSQ